MNLILTLDYELFGDGSGNVFSHIIEPTEQILQLCANYGIKITIFFEAIEYLKLKKEWDNGNMMGYLNNPIEAMETQIQIAAINGHDIQLHIHPQWVNAKYTSGKWELDLNNWRLGDFKVKSKYSIKELLEEGKNALEKLITPVMPEYKCNALRAGGYNIMPSIEVYSAMIEIGLTFDSSIYPGGYENGFLSRFDYRNVPLDRDFWWADEKDIRNPSENDKKIIEIPIFALPVRRWRKVLNLSKVKSLLLNQTSFLSATSSEKFGNKNLIKKIKFMCEKEAYTWDFCMFSKSIHKKYFYYIEKNLADKRSTFVLIGHPKNLQNKEIFKTFLKLANKKRYYSFKTLSEKYAEVG